MSLAHILRLGWLRVGELLWEWCTSVSLHLRGVTLWCEGLCLCREVRLITQAVVVVVVAVISLLVVLWHHWLLDL